jgi:hypothetical protein
MIIDFTPDEVSTIGLITASLPCTDPEIEKVLASISFKCLAAVDPDGAMDVLVDFLDKVSAE